jgi:diguanylate cyclase (GGDEF)-like protein
MLNIFLLEDDDADSLLISLTLKKSGVDFKLTTAKTLEQAKETINTCTFDCAILDNTLPDGKGLTLLDSLQDTPCIMLTGLADEAYAIKAIQQGLEDYISKDSITPKNLIKSITYAIERNTIKKQLVATQKKLDDLSKADPLTGLLNRRGLDEVLNRLATRDTSHGIILIDIDNFKTINDNFGYNAGDTAIKYIADKLSKEVRPFDIVSRVGGDEFIILVQNVDITACKLVAERIRSAIAFEQVTSGDNKFSITVSIGVSTVNQVSKNIELLLKLTQNALKQSKSKGKNAVYA